ncbi:MAG: YesL family protein [Lachnospiraceae bacterium]|nr:YesL family protein [Lachnospiraceae bacterium]
MDMNTMFNPENRFWGFLNKISDALFIGILWYIACIPVITAGAATTSLYQFTLKQTDDEEGYVWRSFWKAFRRNFIQATILWLIILAAGIFVAADLWACMTIAPAGLVRIISLALLLCLALAYVLTALYVFPILSRFDLPVKTILTHSLVMAMGNLPVSITMLVIDAAFLALSWRALLLFPVFMGLAAFVNSYLLRHVFSRYWEDHGEKPEP